MPQRFQSRSPGTLRTTKGPLTPARPPARSPSEGEREKPRQAVANPTDIAIRKSRCPGWQKRLLAATLAFGVSLVLAYVATDLLIERGAYLQHFGQSWKSHFAPAKAVEYGSGRFITMSSSEIPANS